MLCGKEIHNSCGMLYLHNVRLSLFKSSVGLLRSLFLKICLRRYCKIISN